MIDLRPDHLKIVTAILSRHVPEYEVRAFGSRVDGRAKPHSDLDLVVMTASPLAPSRLADLTDAFSDSDLPFRVDVLDWASITEDFRRIIERENVVVQTKQTSATSLKHDPD